MPSTYSTNLRLELIASGEQGNTWGNTTNTNLGTLLESAITGRRELIFAANTITLTAYNGANDESRQAVLVVPVGSLSAAGTITVPLSALSSTSGKTYVVINNASQPVTIKAGSSTGVVIPAGTTKMVCYNGTDFVETVTAASSLLLATSPTLTLQAATKGYVDTADATKVSKAGGVSNQMTGDLLLSTGGAPSSQLGAVPLQYVQSTYLPLTGGTISGGYLSLNYIPTLGPHAVNKNYVDAFTITPVTIGGQSATPLEVAGTAGSGIALAVKTATASALGVVKGGGNVVINADGTMNVTGVGSGSVTSVAITAANGFTGSVANPTTTPAITIGVSTGLSGLVKASGGSLTNAVTSDVTSLIGGFTYYPYSSNPSGYITSSALTPYATQSYVTSQGYVTSSGSVAFASSAGSCTGNSATATTATFLTNNYGYTASNPTFSTTSTATGLFFTGYLKALTVANNSNVANYGCAIVMARGNSSGGGSLGSAALINYGSTLAGAIEITGTNTVAYNSVSDYRLKENEVPLANALDRVSVLKPYRFNFKSEPDRALDGFFAHEVSEVVPEAVTGVKDALDEEGNVKAQAMDPAKLVPLLTAAIQELNAKIETLTAEVNTLKGN